MKRVVPPPAAKPSMPFQLLSGAASFAVMGLLGWAVMPNEPAKSSTQDPNAARGHEERITKKARGPTGAAAEQLQRIRTARDPNERTRATVDLAMKLSPSEFGEWLEKGWFNIRGGEGQTLFTKILQERWRNEDPDGLLEWTLQSKNSDYSIAELVSDPEKVFEFFRTHPDSPREYNILYQLAKDHPEEVLKRLQEKSSSGDLRNSGYGGSLLQTLAKQSPSALEAALASFSEPLKTQAEGALVSLRLQSSPAAELRKLMERPDGLKVFKAAEDMNMRDEAKAKIFDELGNMPADWRAAIAKNPYTFISGKDAARWLQTDLSQYDFTPEQVKRIQSQAFSSLMSDNSVSAAKLLGKLQLDDETRKDYLSTIGGYWTSDKDKYAEMLAALPSDADREAVKRARGRGESEDEGETVAKIETPDQWLEKVSTLDPKRGGSYEYFYMIREWDQGKRDALAAKFRTLSAEAKSAVAQAVANDSSDRGMESFRGEAIRYLVANPPPPADASDPFASRNGASRTVGMASNYVSRMASQNPEGAAEWVRTLPEGDARLWAGKNLHALWSQYDPKAADQWRDTLPMKERNAMDALGKQQE